MIKRILHLAIWLFAFNTCIGQTNPLITAWQLNTTGATGYKGYATNVKQVLYSNTSVYIKTNDLADYIPVNAGSGAGQVDWWPNNPWFPDSMGYTFRFRLAPTPNTGAPRKPPYGHIGVWRNGVSIYSPLDAKSYKGDTTWFQNAYFWEHLLLETFDECWGHPNGSKEYHTHQSPACVYDQTDSLNHSPIIGFAFDGYPIYGCYGYTNTDGTGAIKRMKTSYRLRNITNRTTLPNGTVLPPARYGPIVDPTATNIPPSNQSPVGAPLGAYQEDYEYIAGLGDLDDHNGRFSITPDYPLGTYAYFVTLDATLTPEFPYALGLTYYGRIIQQDGNLGPNSGFVTINETVTNYVPVSGTSQVEIETEFEVFPNPASDQISFLLKSNDFSSVMKGEIYNQSGQLVISGDVSTNRQYAFNTSNLNAGVYFLRITTNKKTYSTKFIVTK